MLVGIFGTPSPLTYWTLKVVRVIAQTLDPDAGFIYAVHLTDIERAWEALDKRSRGNVIVFSDCPESTIVDLFLSRGIRVLVVADEPYDVAEFIVATREMQIEHAVRFVAQTVCVLAGFSGSETVLNIRKDAYATSVRDYLRLICVFFDFSLDAEHFERILVHLDVGTDSRVGDEIIRCIPHSRWPGEYADLDPSARSLVERVVVQYGAILDNGVLEHLIWPRDMFVDWDNRDRVLNGPQSLTGEARFLICGPYLHLPRGTWKVRVEIEVADNTSGNEMRSDVVCGGIVLTGITAALPKVGAFSYEMIFEVTEPFLFLDLRLQILQGAIEGLLLFRGAFIELVSNAPRAEALRSDLLTFADAFEPLLSATGAETHSGENAG